MLLDDDDIILENSLEVPINPANLRDMSNFEYLKPDEYSVSFLDRLNYDFRYTYSNGEQVDFVVTKVDKNYVVKIFIPMTGEATSYTVGRLYNILDCINEIRHLYDWCNYENFDEEKIKILDKYLS